MIVEDEDTRIDLSPEEYALLERNLSIERNIRFSEDLFALVNREAEREGKRLTSFVRYALYCYIQSKHKQKGDA